MCWQAYWGNTIILLRTPGYQGSSVLATLGYVTQRLVLCWQAYWGNTSLQTNQEYDYQPAAPPTLWNYTVCAEGSSQFFWTGGPPLAQNPWVRCQ